MRICNSCVHCFLTFKDWLLTTSTLSTEILLVWSSLVYLIFASLVKSSETIRNAYVHVYPNVITSWLNNLNARHTMRLYTTTCTWQAQYSEQLNLVTEQLNLVSEQLNLVTIEFWMEKEHHYWGTHRCLLITCLVRTSCLNISTCITSCKVVK